jgi:hypothetical protein
MKGAYSAAAGRLLDEFGADEVLVVVIGGKRGSGSGVVAKVINADFDGMHASHLLDVLTERVEPELVEAIVEFVAKLELPADVFAQNRVAIRISSVRGSLTSVARRIRAGAAELATLEVPFAKQHAIALETMAMFCNNVCASIEGMLVQVFAPATAVELGDVGRENVVHVLLEGRPLCGFSPAPPNEWRPNHRWTRIDDLDNVTCKDCLIRARARAS